MATTCSWPSSPISLQVYTDGTPTVHYSLQAIVTTRRKRLFSPDTWPSVQTTNCKLIGHLYNQDKTCCHGYTWSSLTECSADFVFNLQLILFCFTFSNKALNIAVCKVHIFSQDCHIQCSQSKHDIHCLCMPFSIKVVIICTVFSFCLSPLSNSKRPHWVNIVCKNWIANKLEP